MTGKSTIDAASARNPRVSAIKRLSTLAFRLTGRNNGRLIPVGRVTVGNVKAALRRAAVQLENRIEEVIVETIDWPVLRLFFLTWRSVLDEREFFDIIVKSDMVEVVPDLRSLLDAYYLHFSSEAERYHQPWYEADDSVGPLGHALRALVLLDADALADWERYVERRNEHEGFSLTIFSDYAERHGWEKARTFETGSFIAIERIRDGHGPAEQVWNENNLFDQAETHIEAEEFARILSERLNRLDTARHLDKRVLASLSASLIARSERAYFVDLLNHLRDALP